MGASCEAIPVDGSTVRGCFSKIGKGSRALFLLLLVIVTIFLYLVGVRYRLTNIV